MPDWWSNLTGAFGKAWNDVYSNVGNEWNNGQGAFAVLDGALSPAEIAISGIGNLINPNPGHNAVDNAVNAIVPGGVTVGGGYGTNTGGYVGPAPTPTPAPRNIEEQANPVIQQQSDRMSNVAMPSIPSVYTPGNPGLAPSNALGLVNSNNLGMTPIHIATPQTQTAPSVGMTPIFSYPSSNPFSSLNDSSSPVPWMANGGAATPSITPPASTSKTGSANVATPDTSGDTKNRSPYEGIPNPITGAQALAAGAGLLGAGANLANGVITSNAEKDAAAAQAAGQDKVLQLVKDQAAQQQKNIQPWLDAGTSALGKLSTFDTDHPMGSFTASPGLQFPT